MKKVLKSKFIDTFNLRPFGQKGWFRSDTIICPKCGRSDKFGISVELGIVHCFRDDFKQSLPKYLKSIGREDLLIGEESVNIDLSLKTIREREMKRERSELLEISLPSGFTQVISDSYLDQRNFLDQHYNLFKPGYSTDPNFKDNIIFQIFQNNILRGYQCRSKRSKEWHKRNLELFKLKQSPLILRYKDMPGMDTSQLLGGYDDISRETTTLILVEGLFDKVGIDKKLDLYNTKDVRCCFTFGNKVTPNQVELLRQCKNLELIYLLFDEGTLQTSKQAALLLSKYFEVRVSMMKGVDPGDATPEQIFNRLENSTSAINFFLRELSRI